MFFKEKFNPQIQYLRGISILLVFLFHLNLESSIKLSKEFGQFVKDKQKLISN